MKNAKPKLLVDEQITYLENKGVKFNNATIAQAKDFLTNNNNYFKLTAYRKLFKKHPDGVNKGKYVDLEFAMLQDLSVIDMRIRYALLHMALDIEHYVKVKLLRAIEDSDNDGYEIVEEYINQLQGGQLDILNREIENSKKSPYCCNIITKYDGCFPVWAFVEVITFGRLISFYLFCGDYLSIKDLVDDGYLLLSTKAFRNAAAHSNCLINDLSPGNTQHKTNYGLNRELMRLTGMSKEIRDRKMSNVRMQQIVTLLFTHKKLVKSDGTREHQGKVLNELMERMFRNIDYYQSNDSITTNFNFLKLIIDNWFPIV